MQGQPGGQGGALDFAAREPVPEPLRKFFRRQSHAGHSVIDAVFEAFRFAAQPEAVGDVFEDVSFEQIGVLKQVGHAAAQFALAAGRSLPVEDDRAGRRRFEEGEDLEQRRFAAAVGPHKPRDAALGDLERVDVERDGPVFVAMFEVREFVKVFAHGAPPS